MSQEQSVTSNAFQYIATLTPTLVRRGVLVMRLCEHVHEVKSDQQTLRVAAKIRKIFYFANFFKEKCTVRLNFCR